MQGRSAPNPELLDATALCRQLVADGSVHAFLADHRRELFPDEVFADLFPSGPAGPRCRPTSSPRPWCSKPSRGLSDRQAADALRCDIRWKVATGLPLDHPGIHFTVFTYWRSRLERRERPERIREAVAEVIADGPHAVEAPRASENHVPPDKRYDTTAPRRRRLVRCHGGAPAHEFDTARALDNDVAAALRRRRQPDRELAVAIGRVIEPRQGPWRSARVR